MATTQRLYLKNGQHYNVDSTITLQENAAHELEIRFRSFGNWLTVPHALVDRSECACPAPLPMQSTTADGNPMEICANCNSKLLIFLDTPTFRRKIAETPDRRTKRGDVGSGVAQNWGTEIICPECNTAHWNPPVTISRFTCPACATELIYRPYDGGWAPLVKHKVEPTPLKRQRSETTVHSRWSFTIPATGETLVICGVCNDIASRSRVGRMDVETEHIVQLVAYIKTDECVYCGLQPFPQNGECDKNPNDHANPNRNNGLHFPRYLPRSVKVAACDRCGGISSYTVKMEELAEIMEAYRNNKPPKAVQVWQKALAEF